MGHKKIEEVVGTAFEDLTADEMANTQGAGDVDAEAYPTIVGPVCSPSVATISIITVIKDRK